MEPEQPPADEEQPPAVKGCLRKKRALKADPTDEEVAAHADAKKKGKSNANVDNESIGSNAAVAKVLDGKAHELSEHDRELAEKYFRYKAAALRTEVFEFARATGAMWHATQAKWYVPRDLRKVVHGRTRSVPRLRGDRHPACAHLCSGLFGHIFARAVPWHTVAG